MAKHKRKFTNIELSFFCNQLAMILSSGISCLEGLLMMMEETENEEEKIILSDIVSFLNEGRNLHEALKETGLFPPYLLQMVKIGEETGKLDDVFASLSYHYQREDSIKNSVLHALTYPAIMTAMMILVILVLLLKVLPIFNQVFIQLGSEMTGFAGLLVSLGNHLSKYLVPVIAVLLLIATLAFYFGRRYVHHIPFLKDVYEKIAACRFASGMALSLSSGLNPDTCLNLVYDLNEDTVFAKKLDICKESMTSGEDLSKALVSAKIFSGLYARMASIGSKSGTMDVVMQQIAESYQEEVDNRINQILAIIEPTLVVVLSLIVGVILLSVMFPLIGIMSAL